MGKYNQIASLSAVMAGSPRRLDFSLLMTHTGCVATGWLALKHWLVMCNSHLLMTSGNLSKNQLSKYHTALENVMADMLEKAMWLCMWN